MPFFDESDNVVRFLRLKMFTGATLTVTVAKVMVTVAKVLMTVVKVVMTVAKVVDTVAMFPKPEQR